MHAEDVNSPISLACDGHPNSNDAADHYSYNVHLLNGTWNSPRHSLDDHIHFNSGAALPKQQSFVSPPVSNSTSNFPTSTAFDNLRSRPRTLTDVVTVLSVCDQMNALANELPGSPPGLTASKSSKSSTDRSSSASGPDGILSDITHFEDIGLEEEETQSFQQKPLHGINIQKASKPSVAAANMIATRSNAGVPTPMRDLTNQQYRPVYPRLPDSYKGSPATHSLCLPNGAPMRKFSRNASTPSLAIKAMSNYNRSRSPSPKSASSPFQKPSPNLRSPGRPGLISAQTQPLPIRRPSRQTNRKTVKELEAECNDSDEDDLPDDASLWNVPISPNAPQEVAVSLSPGPSPKISPSASPDRSSPLRTSIGSDGTQITAPKTAPIPNVRRTLPASFQSPLHSPHRFLRGASTSTIPDYPMYTRSKSWNVALSDLSEEAKALTDTLKTHAMTTEARRGSAVQSGEENGMEKLSRVKTAPIVELPPLRANNIMIDPLPISKEKEKVLSRTRPSWLPPKSKTEEKKHLKEYKRMMEVSREAERRRAEKAVDTQCAKDDTRSTLLRIWEQHVLPNWDQVIREPRTRELWWRGVAPKSRAQVWQKAIGNELALTDVTYKKALQRARIIRQEINSSKFETRRREMAWFDAIQRDVKTVFPELRIFQPGAPLHDGLVDVLTAYSMYRSDVGYSYGTHLITAFLHLTMPTPAQTFICLANLLNRPLPLAFLTGDPAGTRKSYDLTLSLLQKKHPRLYQHLFGSQSPDAPVDGVSASSGHPPSQTSSTPLSLTPEDVLEPMIRTLFLAPGTGVGIDIAARVWDVMVFDGDAAVFRTVVAILGLLESKLYGSRDEVLAVLGWQGNLGTLCDEEAFMAEVRAVGRVT